MEQPSLTLDGARLFRGHKYTFAITVSRAWKEGHGVSDSDLLRSGLGAVCVRADFRTSRPLNCGYCGGVFRVTDPEIRCSDAKETVVAFGVTPQCSSSRIHLKSQILLRVELPRGSGFVFSQPFIILARERKSSERGTPEQGPITATPTATPAATPLSTPLPSAEESPTTVNLLPPLDTPATVGSTPDIVSPTGRVPTAAVPLMVKQSFAIVSVFVPFVVQFQENGLAALAMSWERHVEALRHRCRMECPNAVIHTTESQGTGLVATPGMLVIVFCTSAFDEVQRFRAINAAWSAEVLNSGTARQTGVFTSW